MDRDYVLLSFTFSRVPVLSFRAVLFRILHFIYLLFYLFTLTARMDLCYLLLAKTWRGAPRRQK